MSAEANVKIVQEMYRAFLRRDVPGILVHLDDDIIWTRTRQLGRSDGPRTKTPHRG